jgi:hypothetical protein
VSIIIKGCRVAILWNKGWISVDVGHGVREENFVASSSSVLMMAIEGKY